MGDRSDLFSSACGPRLQKLCLRDIKHEHDGAKKQLFVEALLVNAG
jgi:hypothetical protein